MTYEVGWGNIIQKLQKLLCCRSYHRWKGTKQWHNQQWQQFIHLSRWNNGTLLSQLIYLLWRPRILFSKAENHWCSPICKCIYTQQYSLNWYPFICQTWENIVHFTQVLHLLLFSILGLFLLQFRKEGEENDPIGINSNGASRGNWWQGMKAMNFFFYALTIAMLLVFVPDIHNRVRVT